MTFGAVTGFIGPEARDVMVTDGGTITVMADYLAPGSVTVTGNIPETTFLLFGETASGEVQLSGGGESTTFIDLPPGTYTAFFEVALGFATPPDQSGTLVEGGTLTLNGDYQLVPAAISVQTNLAQATFTVTGDTVQGPVTLNGGSLRTIFLAQPAGDYTVTFDPVPDFTTPAPQSGTLTATTSLSLEGVYVATSMVQAPARNLPDPDGPVVAFAVPPAVSTAGAEQGFGTGTLTVVTDAPGATFRIVGQGAPTEMALIEPGGTIGNGASLAGAMLNLADPFLVSGQEVPFVIVAEDSASPPNRARRAYSVRVFNLPNLSSVEPATAAQSFFFDLEVFGFGLRTEATLSLGGDIAVEPPSFGLGRGGAISLLAEARVDPDAVVSTRDLIYIDTALSNTALGSEVRLPEALRLFAELNSVDLDGSGRVDGFDLARAGRAFGRSQGDAGFDPLVDFTRDGTIDGSDLGTMSIVFGRQSLVYDLASLPLPDGTVGVPYETSGSPIEVGFIGGNTTLVARLPGGSLPDGLRAFMVAGATPPSTSVLRFEGVPAGAGTFNFTIQTVDGFFAIATRQFTLVVNPPTP